MMIISHIQHQIQYNTSPAAFLRANIQRATPPQLQRPITARQFVRPEQLTSPCLHTKSYLTFSTTFTRRRSPVCTAVAAAARGPSSGGTWQGRARELWPACPTRRPPLLPPGPPDETRTQGTQGYQFFYSHLPLKLICVSSV